MALLPQRPASPYPQAPHKAVIGGALFTPGLDFEKAAARRAAALPPIFLVLSLANLSLDTYPKSDIIIT